MADAGEVTGVPEPRPDDEVFLDIACVDGLVVLDLVNVGATPVSDVRVSFSDRILGPTGRDLTALPVFRSTRFLAPGRRLRVPVDTPRGYVARGQPDVFTVKLRWQHRGRSVQRAWTHDVRCVLELPTVHRPPSSRSGVRPCPSSSPSPEATSPSRSRASSTPMRA